MVGLLQGVVICNWLGGEGEGEWRSWRERDGGVRGQA